MSDMARWPTEKLIAELRSIKPDDLTAALLAEALARLLTDNIVSGVRKR